MTTKEYLIAKLEVNGLFRKQAEEIVDFAIPKMELELCNNGFDYQITWNRPSDEYPDFMLGLLFSQMKKFVIEWAKKNVPMAWWIPMFQ